MTTASPRKTTTRKKTVTKTEEPFDIPLVEDGGKAFEKLITDERFVASVYPDEDEKIDPVLQLSLLRRMMKSIFGKEGYRKLAEHYDHDMTKMQEFMEGKVSKLGESDQAE